MSPSSKNKNSASKDDPNLFEVIDYDHTYWENYLTARPRYTEDFYELILDYHNSHGGSFAVAQDVGTGPGQVAGVLSENFRHVIASDNNATHLAVAQHRLAELANAKNKVTFENASVEEIASKYPPASADLVTAAECLPLMDAKLAVQNFAALLRPGGSLAIWFYGRPAFSEETYGPQCQKLFNKIVNKSFAKIIRVGGPKRLAGWKKTMDRIESWLDDIELSAEQWGNVERRKWNPDLPMPFFEDSVIDFDFDRINNVAKGEKVLEETDRSFWAKKWCTRELKTFIDVNLPSFQDGDGVVDEEIEGWYKELEAAMGGKDAKRDIAWPVVLILATRK